LISSGIIDLQTNRVCKQLKHWNFRISVPMLYIAVVEEAANPSVFWKNDPEGFKSSFDTARL